MIAKPPALDVTPLPIVSVFASVSCNPPLALKLANWLTALDWFSIAVPAVLPFNVLAVIEPPVWLILPAAALSVTVPVPLLALTLAPSARLPALESVTFVLAVIAALVVRLPEVVVSVTPPLVEPTAPATTSGPVLSVKAKAPFAEPEVSEPTALPALVSATLPPAPFAAALRLVAVIAALWVMLPAVAVRPTVVAPSVPLTATPVPPPLAVSVPTPLRAPPKVSAPPLVVDKLLPPPVTAP